MSMSTSDAAKIIAMNIRQLLIDYKLTRADLAERLGVSTATVGYWCTGKKIPRMDKVDAMCDTFNVTRSQLLLPASDVKPSFTLSDDEQELLFYFRNADEVGRAGALSLLKGRQIVKKEQAIS